MNSVTQRFSRFRMQISSNAKSRQDPSMRLRLSRDDRLWHRKSPRTPVSKAAKAVNRHTVWSFVPLQRKTQCLRQNQGCKGSQTVNRQTIQEFCFAEFLSFCTRLWVKQEFPAAKALVGDDRLWHLKYPNLPKASSQSPEKKCRFQRREPAYSPRIRLAPNSGAFCLCREKRSVLGKTRSQRRQKRKPAN